MARAWIALGANLGDRLGQIKGAIAALEARPDTSVIEVSSVYETEPVGPGDQPKYLNAAAEIETELDPKSLLRVLLSIEEYAGRVREERWGPRMLDLDILVYDDLVDLGGDPALPHPRMNERAFVLAPLAEIAPRLVVPGTDMNVLELLGQLEDYTADVRLLGSGPVSAPEE